jgi:hypothetical protein
MGADPAVVTSRLQAAPAFSAGGQVKGDGGAGTAIAGQNPHPVGHLPDEPQAVAGPVRQRVLRGLAGGIRRAGSLDAHAVWGLTRMPGGQRFAIFYLTVQCPGELPYTQASSAGTMTNRVRGQFVNGQDYVLGPVFGQACLTGMSLNSCSQFVEGAGIERQVQDRDTWFACRMVIGHAIASSPVLVAPDRLRAPLSA